VPKRTSDGSTSYRVVTDWRLRNQLVEPDRFPTPTPLELIALVHLTTCKVNRRLARFLETLLRYNITFCYVRGPTNVVADALSRREDYLGGEGEMTLVEQNSKSFHSYFQQQVAKAEAVFLWCLGNTIDSPCPPSYLFCFNQSCGTSTGHLLIGLGLGPH